MARASLISSDRTRVDRLRERVIEVAFFDVVGLRMDFDEPLRTFSRSAGRLFDQSRRVSDCRNFEVMR